MQEGIQAFPDLPNLRKQVLKRIRDTAVKRSYQVFKFLKKDLGVENV
jgi:hypothetical protein